MDSRAAVIISCAAVIRPVPAPPHPVAAEAPTLAAGDCQAGGESGRRRVASASPCQQWIRFLGAVDPDAAVRGHCLRWAEAGAKYHHQQAKGTRCEHAGRGNTKAFQARRDDAGALTKTCRGTAPVCTGRHVHSVTVLLLLLLLWQRRQVRDKMKNLLQAFQEFDTVRNCVYTVRHCVYLE